MTASYSADQIHALFTTSHGRQHYLYGKVKPTSRGSSDDKGMLSRELFYNCDRTFHFLFDCIKFQARGQFGNLISIRS
jgi:hypothetical protein